MKPPTLTPRTPTTADDMTSGEAKCLLLWIASLVLAFTLGGQCAARQMVERML